MLLDEPLIFEHGSRGRTGWPIPVRETGAPPLPPELAREDDLAGLPEVSELEVLRLLGQGLTNKAIAQRLGISDNTVKFHVNAILGKLGAASRTEATVIAARLGLIMV